MDVLLTSENYVRTTTNISDNLQSKFLQSAIREAQEISLQKVIGTKLYEKLIALVSDGTIEDDENKVYLDLLDKTQYFLAYQTVVNLVIISTYKINNIGINTTTDENVQIPQMNDVFRLEEYYQKKADFYTKRLQEYCLKHRSELKELSDNDCHDMESHLSNCVSNGLMLTGKRGKGSYYRCHRGYDKP